MLSSNQKLFRWGLIFVLFIAFLWLFGEVLTPYIAAMVLAYFLDPVADRLELLGFKRFWAAFTILVVTFLLLLIIILLVLPSLIEQTSKLIAALPEVFNTLQAEITSRFPDFQFDLAKIADRFGVQIQKGILGAGEALITSTKTVIGVISLLVIVPIVTLFILLDWDKMVALIDSYLPRDYVADIREVSREIDRTISAFIRGQGTVCLTMAVYYAIVLSLAGLPYGIAIGVLAGLFTFIPYIGALFAGILVVGFGLYAYIDNIPHLLIIFALYFGGQAVEGNIISPNLVGDRVGLHPVWMLFALSAFGYLMGFSGILLGVPIAASIAVVIRFFLRRYRTSILYLGNDYEQSSKD